MTSFVYGTRSPRCHYDVHLAPMALTAPVLIMMSFAAELATPSVTDERTYGHLTAFNI